MMKNKKGLSGVVTTVLIILLAIIAVSIIAVVVNNILKKSSTDITNNIECTRLSLEIKSAKYYNATYGGTLNNSVDVVVKRDAGAADINRMRVLVSGKAYDQTSVPGEGETITYNIVNITAKPTKIEVAGMLRNSESPCRTAPEMLATEIA